jgi:hypothetical protein
VIQIILTIVLTITTMIGGPASQPASQPLAQPVSQVTSDPASFTLAPFGLPATWAPEALSDAGISKPANVTILFQNEYNCGAEVTGLGGCTVKRTDIDGWVILISPELAYTAWGNHILFHELAHTMGAGECEAEAYAHQFEAVALWSYPECQAF